MKIQEKKNGVDGHQISKRKKVSTVGSWAK